MFGFADAFMSRDMKRAVSLNVNPHAAMGAIYQKAGMLYRFMSYRNRGLNDFLIFQKMEVPVFLQTELQLMARRWTAEKLIGLFERLAELSMRERSGADGVMELLLLAMK